MEDRPLGRRAPTDWRHVERYPLTAATAPTAPTPVAIGVNWYVEFDQPRDEAGNAWAPGRTPKGHWWIAHDGKLTKVRGGHCVALKPKGVADNTSWWDFYDQGAEGACVGFGCSRVMTLLNRKRYLARWLWDMAKSTDEWPETNPGDDDGTSVRAGLEILRTLGHVAWRSGMERYQTDWRARDTLRPVAGEGISAYRWATKADDALDLLGYGGLDYVDVINSWGRSYPHLVRMPADVLQKLLEQDGEVGLPTDR